ncbi:hypothetical protein CASFOL_013206 [Castilleja foliolosa]|uniref:F-box associated beta-propeller type 1 domain-containing protein n=1 Tax=Castilleja foliolosa TaxID=1961234 RepID=A0ABD3DL77_9LAMI
MNITSVQIYSVNLESWITIDVGFQFRLFAIKNDLIVNGNPYWVALVDGNNVLVCLDVSELIFKIVPWPTNYWMSLDEVAGEDADMDDLLVFEEETEIKTWTATERVVELVDWNGAIGALIIKYEVEYCGGPLAQDTECVRVWVFDDIERIWRNDHTCGPIEVDVYRGIYCSKNGKVMGTLSSGTLFLLDLETGFVKELFDGACFGSSFEVYAYTESLAYINGMERWL